MHGGAGHKDSKRDNANEDSSLKTILARRIRERGPISFAGFMEAALYHPEAGYYRRRGNRIGTDTDTDFYTAYAAGGVFADLIGTATRRLLGDSPKDPVLVEIGIEPGRSLWDQPPEGFGGLRSVALGESLEIPPHAVVFSNELFDAQPFHRVRFHNGAWREAGVGLRGDTLIETLLPETTAEVRSWRERLPESVPENTAMDLSLGAVSVLETLVAQSWKGLFLAFDYGKRWAELCWEHPEGTLRGYSRHRQNPDILDSPGEQDLTGHICWDWMIETLAAHGFRDIRLESQEAFFVRNAAPAIERIIRNRPGLPDSDRNRLHQLIHPAYMGQKFQVLSARRG